MLRWLHSIQKPHVAESVVKTMRQALVELPSQDPLAALEELTRWVGRIADNPEYDTLLRLELFFILDESAVHYRQRLAKEYLTQSRQVLPREQAVWEVSHGFWRAYALAITREIASVAETASGEEALHPSLMLAVVRAFQALRMQLKWRYFRYQPVPQSFWQDVADLWWLVERQGWSRRWIPIYPVQEIASCAETEMLKLLVLAMSACDGLLPLQIEITDRLVDSLGPEFELVVQENAVYEFSLSPLMPPRRHEPGSAVSAADPSHLWFTARRGLMRLHAMIADIEAGHWPSGLNVNVEYPSRLVLLAMRHCLAHWQQMPPARQHARTMSYARMVVCQGLADIAHALQVQAGGREEETHESWVVQNVSDGGVGALLTVPKQDWLAVGGLLGLRFEHETQWRLGIIRRLRALDDEQMYVGIEIKSAAPEAVSLTVAQPAPEADWNRHDESALVLQQSGGFVQIALRTVSYHEEYRYELRRERIQLLANPTVLERGDHFTLVRFAVVA